VCTFICSRQTGGKGFHYFLRDLATLLISWGETYTPTQRDSQLCSQVLNTLIKISADKSKIIFNINIEIVATLMHKWR